MKKDINKLFQDLKETYDNLLELQQDGYFIKTNQVIAATYTKVGCLTALSNNNPDFLYRKELADLIDKIDIIFDISRDKTNIEKESEK